MSHAEPMQIARRIALATLSDMAFPTEADMETAVRAAIAALGVMGASIDPARLRRRLEADVSVYIGEETFLDDDDSNHQPWVDARRGEIDWRFWDAYRDWQSGRLPRQVIRGLDRVSDDILDRLEDPRRGGRWDRRGMVVGQVQSGKTSNYTALICKAADAGYKFIVVLAGLHNSLRSQTQMRLDEGFLGLDSRTTVAFANTNRAIGVGRGRTHPPAFTLTSSDEKGNFARAVAGRVAGRIGSDPILLVVLKNRTIMENLIDWVTSINGRPHPSDPTRMIVSSFPLLVVDDEADNASVNTRKIDFERDEEGQITGESDPSAINKQIRRLLHSFERSAFVSYTATPFANIFIDEEEPSPRYGEDLFPRSFILRIPPPSNYVGPAEVFGVPPADDPAGVGRPGLPVLRDVEDNEGWLRTGHRKDATPGRAPDSLREAIRSFLIACAVRAARGQVDVHNSMLIHVTRFIDVQAQVCEQVQGIVDALRDRLAAADPILLQEFHRLYESDFVITRGRMPPELRGAATEWQDVLRHLPGAVSRLKRDVLQVNGSAKDALEYSSHPGGVSLIAVGGDKLSRGLTLEGLTVSYYLRASKMYDTLMQMGRWFGYRDGYTDLIRLYTTPELQTWYRDITVANEELSEKFDEMARVGSNPRDFSLYVRKSPAGLLVTAQTKMRHGLTMELTFSGEVIETIGFRRDPTEQEANLSLIDRTLEAQTAAGRRVESSRHHVWRDVLGEDVAAMLDRFRAGERARKARGPLLARYIRSRLPHAELTNWTVVLIDNSQAKRSARVGDLEIGLTQRSYYRAGDREASVQDADEYAIRRLGDPGHEQLDLTPAELQRATDSRRSAMEEAVARARELDLPEPRPLAMGPFVRRVRPVDRGLLVVYGLDPADAGMDRPSAIPAFLISFPVSPGAPTISYVIPKRYWEQEVA